MCARFTIKCHSWSQLPIRVCQSAGKLANETIRSSKRGRQQWNDMKLMPWTAPLHTTAQAKSRSSIGVRESKSFNYIEYEFRCISDRHRSLCTDCVKLRLLVKLYRIVAMRVALQRTNQYELLRHTQWVWCEMLSRCCRDCLILISCRKERHEKHSMFLQRDVMQNRNNAISISISFHFIPFSPLSRRRAQRFALSWRRYYPLRITLNFKNVAWGFILVPHLFHDRLRGPIRSLVNRKDDTHFLRKEHWAYQTRASEIWTSGDSFGANLSIIL